MAIDTEDKRRSTVGLWAVIRVLPVPNGSINAGDRAHLWVYRGHFDVVAIALDAIFFGVNA